MSSAPRSSSPLAKRRRSRRRRLLIVSLILLLLLLGTALYGLWQPAVRISTIEVRGEENLLPGLAVTDVAREALRGAYGYVIPRDSIFFYPARRVRHAIVEAHPEIATISVKRTGLSSISIRVLERTAVGRWCGIAPPQAADCYFFDPNGFIYALVPATEASSTIVTTNALNPFEVYAPLEGERAEPLRATIARANQLPDTFTFAREMSDFGSSVTAVVIRDDEVDLRLASGTRVTYVIGREQDAYTALTSAKGNLNLAEGSINYVDLRFAGKVYLKKR